MTRTTPEAWKITMGLCGVALLAALVAPQLRPPDPEPELETATDLCLRLGPYECCYVPEDP